jgi:outer membrane protein assembly factor BamA
MTFWKITNKSNNGLEGKIIRTIFINKNPLNVSNSEKSNFQKGIANHLGSYTHLQTRSFVVRNLLLFKENEKFDSLLIQESERLIREQRYIEKCSIVGVSSDVSSDSVDVIVEIKDVFSLIPEADFSSSKYSLGFREINVLGLGHRFQTSFLFGMPNIFTDYDLNYYYP